MTMQRLKLTETLLIGLHHCVATSSHWCKDYCTRTPTKGTHGLLPVQNLIVRELLHVVSDRRIVGTHETRYSTASQWRLQPTGALRKGQEAAEETREESDLTAPIQLFHTDVSFTAADPFALGKLSRMQNYLLSTWEPRCNDLKFYSSAREKRCKANSRDGRRCTKKAWRKMGDKKRTKTYIQQGRGEEGAETEETTVDTSL